VREKEGEKKERERWEI